MNWGSVHAKIKFDSAIIRKTEFVKERNKKKGRVRTLHGAIAAGERAEETWTQVRHRLGLLFLTRA